MNSAEWRAAELGGVNGHSNARGVARIQRVIGNDGVVDGRRVLSPETLDLIWQEQAAGPDQVLFLPLRWGIGFGLPAPRVAPVPPGGPGVLLGWRRWLARGDGPRPAPDDRVHDEPDGAHASSAVPGPPRS